MSDTPTNPEMPIPSDAGILATGTRPDPLEGAKKGVATLWELLKAKLDEKGTREEAVHDVVMAIEAAFPGATPFLAGLEPLMKGLADIGAK